MMEELNEYIKLLKRGEDRVLIGVDGLSRSGKTTFTKRLSTLLFQEGFRVATIHLDDYITPEEVRYGSSFPEWKEYYELQWDVSVLREELFKRMRKENVLKLPKYSQQYATIYEEMLVIEAVDIVIVEGVFLQRPSWRGFFDQVIYLDVPRIERFKRENVETQKKIDKFKRRYWKAEEHYLETSQPALKADLVIDLS
ncbi:kinase [Halobacillus salinus]|uniref:kinase n=1 Tax=Halobacillus salinus TaxID=192814 RepID=UPI0009A77AE0|nr:kinase [Halobacillus salinus]